MSKLQGFLVDSRFGRNDSGSAIVSSICRRLCISRLLMVWRLERVRDKCWGHGQSELPDNQPKRQRMHLILSDLIIGNQRIRFNETVDQHSERR
jgi:hypothetical protein